MQRKWYWILMSILLPLFFVAGIASHRWFQANAAAGMSWVYLDEGRKSIESREYVKAVSLLTKAVTLDGDSILACLSLANAYELNGNYELAINQYQECSQLSRRDGMKTEERLITTKLEELKSKLGKPKN